MPGKRCARVAAAGLVATWVLVAPAGPPAWPQWRGPLGTGAAPAADPPVEWSEQRNVRWKAPLPGKGHSTPVVWGDRIYLTSAVPAGPTERSGYADAPGAHDNVAPRREQRFVVLAIDRRSGAIVWERVVRTARPHAGTHVTGSWASASAVTDGERVIASFGSAGLYALDADGELLWQKDLGEMEIFHGHGEGSSPALHGDTVIVNWDHQGQSFVVALDKRNGNERWRVARDEITSWSSPLIVEHGERAQVVISATNRVRAYALDDGAELWEWGGLSRNVVATPVAADGMLFAASSYDVQAMVAIRLDAARGDVTGGQAVAWTRRRDTPYVPSPVLDGGELCFLKHNQALLTCVEAASGEPRGGPRRLAGLGNIFASPVAAAGRIYVVDRNGGAVVVDRDGDRGILARNRLDDSFSASPAVVGRELFLRGEHHLYCIARAGAAGTDSRQPAGRN